MESDNKLDHLVAIVALFKRTLDARARIRRGEPHDRTAIEAVARCHATVARWEADPASPTRQLVLPLSLSQHELSVILLLATSALDHDVRCLVVANGDDPTLEVIRAIIYSQRPSP